MPAPFVFPGCAILQENHFFLAVGEVGSAASDVQQSVEYVKDHDKEEFLLHWLDREFTSNPKSLILVFVETKRQCDKLEYILCESGVKAASIHGDRDQGERESALHAFRDGHRPVLVATSVASRGSSSLSFTCINVTHSPQRTPYAQASTFPTLRGCSITTCRPAWMSTCTASGAQAVQATLAMRSH